MVEETIFFHLNVQRQDKSVSLLTNNTFWVKAGSVSALFFILHAAYFRVAFSFALLLY